MPPSRSWAIAAIRRQSSTSATSASTNETSAGRPPVAAWRLSSSAAARALAESRPVISTRAPLRANTLAIPLPIPRVPPVTTTARPAIDVNMAPFPSRTMGTEVRLRQVTAAAGIPGAELGGDVDAPVRADPGDQEQPPEHDERPDFRLVGRRQLPGPAVPVEPAVPQRGHLRRMLKKGDRGAHG